MRYGFVAFVLLYGVLLAGCAAAAPSPTLAPTRAIQTVVTPTAAITPTRSPEPPIPTGTPRAHATNTPEPTAVPTLTQAEQTAMSDELITAAARGDTTHVRELIAAGAPLNRQDANGRTAAMAATHGNHVEVVRALLEAGADVNIRDARLDNPFLYAGAEGQLEILKLAWAAGADPKIVNRFGGTALIPACERGHIEVVEYLLTETTVDVNHINNLGWTCLLEAIILSDGGPAHQEIVRFVIEQGADVNIPDKDRVTPLQHATRQGYTEIEALLLEAGAR